MEGPNSKTEARRSLCLLRNASTEVGMGLLHLHPLLEFSLLVYQHENRNVATTATYKAPLLCQCSSNCNVTDLCESQLCTNPVEEQTVDLRVSPQRNTNVWLLNSGGLKIACHFIVEVELEQFF